MKYLRVMHHIGGLSSANDGTDMIRGGEDELVLLSEDNAPDGIRNMTQADIKRLFELGAVREATADEVTRWEISKGIRQPADPADAFTQFTTGNETLSPDPAAQGAAPVGAGAADAGGLQGGKGADGSDDAAKASAGHSGTYKGMGKGDLSEFTVPELKEMAKEEGVEGFADMNKDPLLEALLALGK